MILLRLPQVDEGLFSLEARGMWSLSMWGCQEGFPVCCLMLPYLSLFPCISSCDTPISQLVNLNSSCSLAVQARAKCGL